MTGRQIILDKIKQNKPEGKALPGSFRPTAPISQKEELLTQFKESLKKAGAAIQEFETRDKLNQHVQNEFYNGTNLLDENIKAHFKGNEIPKSELEKTEILIAEGQFGVAENGAIWLDESNFSNRLLPFVSQQLVLVLDRTQLVPTMHEAYQRTELTDTGFGVFISGPSKTADIEQSLVYGAHGAKELVVALR